MLLRFYDCDEPMTAVDEPSTGFESFIDHEPCEDDWDGEDFDPDFDFELEDEL